MKKQNREIPYLVAVSDCLYQQVCKKNKEMTVFWVRPKADAVVLRGRWYGKVLCQVKFSRHSNWSKINAEINEPMYL